MEVERRAGSRAELDDRAALEQLEYDDLVLDQRRNGHSLASVVAKSHRLVPRGGEDVEAFAQALAKHEELDAGAVAQGRRVLPHEAMARQCLKVSIDGGLRGVELAREVRDADRLARLGQPLEQAERKVDCLGRGRSGGAAAMRSAGRPPAGGRLAQCCFRVSGVFHSMKRCFDKSTHAR